VVGRASAKAVLAVGVEALRATGFTSFRTAKTTYWERPTAGDLRAVCLLGTIGRHGGAQLIGTVGVRVPEFELWWERRIATRLDRQGPPAGMTFGHFITNYPSLRDPPIFTDASTQADEIGRWISAIIGVLETWPTTVLEQARDVISNPRNYQAQTVMPAAAAKLAGFLLWAREVHGVQVPDETWPKISEDSEYRLCLEPWPHTLH
jgi:hypothetical protein